MENQVKKPDDTGSNMKEPMHEVGSNLTGTARPALPDEKELISHHMNKSAHHTKVQNIDTILGTVHPKS